MDSASYIVERHTPRSADKSSKATDAKPQWFNANDLQVMDFPPIEWIVPDILPEGCTLFAGRPKIGKSWMALDIAYAVASGGTCLNGKRCLQGDVLYLALEDNKRRLQSRLKKMHPLDVHWPEHLTFATEWPRASAGGIDQIRQWAQSVKAPRLIVIDVLNAFRDQPGANEKRSTYATDYEAVQTLRDLANELGCAVLIVTHTRKAEAEDPIDAVSGTLGLSGAADTIIVLNRSAESGTTLYGRGRDLESMDLAVRFDPIAALWNVIGQTEDVIRTDERKEILSVLIDSTEPMTPKDISIGAQMARNSVDQLLFKMAKAGEVLKTGRGKYIHPSKTNLIERDPISPHKNDKKVRSEDDDEGHDEGDGDL
jgi:hypothetical protein